MFAALLVAAMLARSDVRSCAARVLKAGGYGHLPLEAAAFIVREGESVRCEMWPRSPSFHSTSWMGRMPEGTLAIIHSHPATIPQPSVQDMDLARRLRIPVLVVTPRGVTAADDEAPAPNLLRKEAY